ncbi:type I-B CRISPR-associated protein Cas8b1/Cst1 [uncultured Methanolobus sp.]|uniref:type I-B CRISPR-associated protein Cas8b1/Cst1 n=1 Tax=uncultured Methanolobus sp. TaxID=218300 RepID=UPI002AAAF20E|nr:type I-B CRISPR-associated protein Cas8b1/Cst1 [uncultured Methanolobus sp.]
MNRFTVSDPLDVSLENTEIFKLDFKETGNYWLDSGIVALFIAFDKHKKLADNFGVTVKGRRFTVEGPDQQTVVGFVSQVIDNLVNMNYISPTQNKDIWYDGTDGEFKLYQKTNFTPFHSALITGVIPSINNKLLVKEMDDDLKNQFETALDSFNEGIEQKAKIGPKQASNVNKAYVPMDIPKLSLKTTLDFDPGKKNCSFCGRSVKKGANPTGVNYPWLTSSNKLKNFNPMHKGKLVMCGYCEAASIAVYDILRYHVNGDRLFVALPHAESLDELRSVWNDIKSYAPTKGTENIYCNFSEQKIPTFHLSENFVYLSIAMYQSIKDYISLIDREDTDAWQRFASKRWYATLGVKTQSLQFHRNFEFARFGNIFRFFDQVTESGDGVDLFHLFGDLFVEKKRGISIANVIHREKICEKLLSFDDITNEVERFTFEKGRPVRGLHQFVKIYMIKSVKEGSRVDENIVEICESIGDRIGKYSYFSKDKGVLFGLRNSKNLTEFLENLNSAQFKMPNEKYSGRLRIPKEFLLSINEKNWRQYKSLITIFAKNPPLKKEDTIEGEGVLAETNEIKEE